MATEFDNNKTEFDDWCDKWEKAQAAGIFKDAPTRVTSPMNVSSSFFGMNDIKPEVSEEEQDSDADYWNAVYAVSTGDPQLISEAKERMEKKDVAKKAETIAKTPNPIRQASVGKDQDVSDEAINASVDPEDVEKLAEMKKKLHNLQSKAAKLDGGEGKIQKQIDALNKQIDELSDKLTKGYDISSQGD